MKKTDTKSSKKWTETSALKAIAYYDSQTDEEAAKEIETARSAEPMAWIAVPAELVPQVRKLIARHKKTA